MEIEKNVPAPSDNRGGPAKYPFVRMEVGDSVLFPECKGSISKEYRAATSVGRTKGWKFVGRTTDEGFRIWRVA